MNKRTSRPKMAITEFSHPRSATKKLKKVLPRQFFEHHRRSKWNKKNTNHLAYKHEVFELPHKDTEQEVHAKSVENHAKPVYESP